MYKILAGTSNVIRLKASDRLTYLLTEWIIELPFAAKNLIRKFSYLNAFDLFDIISYEGKGKMLKNERMNHFVS